MNSFEQDFSDDYEEKSSKYMTNLDFNKLEEVKSKQLKDVTVADLESIGFKKIENDDFDNLFCYADLNGVKVYINKVDDKFELRGFRLRKEKDIESMMELLDETLTKWRLKMKLSE